MTHYDSLGVGKEASAETIRRAYRKKAQENHPDKGGALVIFQAVQKAYDTLSDVEKRARYDSTGEDGLLPSAEKKAQDIILGMFASTAEQVPDDSINLLDVIVVSVREALAKTEQQEKALKSLILRLERRLPRMTKKGKSPNMFARVLEGQINTKKLALAALEEEKKVNLLVQEMLKEHEYAPFAQETTSQLYTAFLNMGRP